MLKWVYWLLVFFILGCATTSDNNYGTIYNQALVEGANVKIIKEGAADVIHASVSRHLRLLGYGQVVDEDHSQGFFVLVKGVNPAKAILAGSKKTDRIILKYTQAGKGKLRIDLVNAAITLRAKKNVAEDIRIAAKLIRAEKTDKM